MRKFNPPSYFANIVANRLFGYLSIKSASILCDISDSTYLKYEQEFRPKVSYSDYIDLSKVIPTYDEKK